tara:strand:+ start:74 stop:526 length:453 start_codon:yes stop_codon:yes gene_type:complete
MNEINKQGHSLMSINGEWVSSNDVAVQAIIDSFDELVPARTEAKARIVEQSQSYMQQIESEYPSFERATWPTQKAEIEAWGLDSASLTPLLDNIAIAREMDRVTLLNRTLAKVQAYNIQAAYLAGTRQKLEDEIDNSTDLDFISSINFEV